MNNLLSVLILNRNNADDVLTIYDDLKKQTFQDFHVIIIDDNSKKSELDKLLNVNDTKFIVYSYPSPWKFGNDNKWSFGLMKTNITGSKYTYTIQTDMKIQSPDLLEKLINHMEADLNCGAACPTIYNGNGIITWGPGIEKIRMGKKYNINETFITRNHVMAKMKYINSKLIYYGHEFYFINWLKMHGYNTRPINEVNVIHYGGGTSSKHQYLKDFYRPKTTILILKLFNTEDSLKTKLWYLFEETSEPRGRMISQLKKIKLINFFRTVIMFYLGLIAGLLVSVKLGK